DIFFPEPEDRSSDEAKMFCQACPVQYECLEDALAKPKHDDHGIRGNSTKAERNRLRQSRKQKPAPTISAPQTCLTCDAPVFVESSEVDPDGLWARAVLCCERGHTQRLSVTLE